MKISSMLIATATIIGASSLSIPAQAVTFADYAAADSNPNIFYSAGNLTGSGETTFSFLTLASSLHNLSAAFSFSASTTSPVVSAGGYDIQPGLGGTFSFTYDGPSITGLATGANLLSGTFTGASIAGPDGGSTGSIQDAIVSGGTVTFTSSELVFLPTGDKALSISLTSLLPGLTVSRGVLADFTGVSTGSFAADLAGSGGGGGVPEPTPWAMMLLGFAGVGLARRQMLAERRRAIV